MLIAMWIAAVGCGDTALMQGRRVQPIAFPGPWLKANDPAAVLMLPGTYQVRRDAGTTGTGVLLFSFQTADGSTSANAYAVSLADGASVRPADRARWDRAQPVAQSRRTAMPAAGAIEWKGRRYEAPGRVLARALISPDERRLAVISYVGVGGRSPSIGSFIGGGEPSAGDLYLDVYSTADGARLATGQAPWKGFGPTVLFDSASWIASEAVVLPVDTLAQRILLVSLAGG